MMIDELHRCATDWQINRCALCSDLPFGGGASVAAAAGLAPLMLWALQHSQFFNTLDSVVQKHVGSSSR